MLYKAMVRCLLAAILQRSRSPGSATVLRALATVVSRLVGLPLGVLRKGGHPSSAAWPMYDCDLVAVGAGLAAAGLALAWTISCGDSRPGPIRSHGATRPRVRVGTSPRTGAAAAGQADIGLFSVAPHSRSHPFPPRPPCGSGTPAAAPSRSAERSADVTWNNDQRQYGHRHRSRRRRRPAQHWRASGPAEQPAMDR